MCAAVMTPPLREPQHYIPAFKVEVCLCQPLWPVDKCLHELMSLCSVLEVLCKREVIQLQKDPRGSNACPSVNFKDKARVILEQLHALSPKLPQGGVVGYVKHSQLAELYPRTMEYLQNPDRLPTNITWTPIDDHQEALAALQRVHGIAKQINNDLVMADNHKYMAHQLALLHQSVTAMSKVTYMVDFKRSIESKFPAIKHCINQAQDDGNVPYLPTEPRVWLQELTSQIIEVCRNPPPEVQECLQPAAQVLVNSAI